MDGMHDLGGRQGFGRVRHSPTAPAFHASWERRANALYSLAVKLGLFNMDEYRHAIERMEPRHYMSASYYERSLTSLATLCVEKGIVTREELERHAQGTFPLSLPGAPGRPNVANRRPIRSPTLTRTACRRPTSPPTTCASALRNSGRTTPIRHSYTSAFSRVTWNGRAEPARAAQARQHPA
jgi:hypothetical protein